MYHFIFNLNVVSMIGWFRDRDWSVARAMWGRAVRCQVAQRTGVLPPWVDPLHSDPCLVPHLQHLLAFLYRDVYTRRRHVDPRFGFTDDGDQVKSHELSNFPRWCGLVALVIASVLFGFREGDVLTAEWFSADVVFLSSVCFSESLLEVRLKLTVSVNYPGLLSSITGLFRLSVIFYVGFFICLLRVNHLCFFCALYRI